MGSNLTLNEPRSGQDAEASAHVEARPAGRLNELGIAV
jgi:hypothetical protein